MKKNAPSISTDRLALATVFGVVLVDLIGFGIVLPLLPFYASRFDAGPVAIGLLYSVYSLAQLLFSPFWGSLSDRIGRRPVMLVSTAGAAMAYLVFAFSHSFTALFLSRCLAGVMGGNISAAQSYIADVTRPEERAKGMGLVGAAFGIGFVLGPALASILIQDRVVETLGALLPFFRAGLAENPFALPGFFAAALSLASLTLVITKLPESLDPAHRSNGAAEERRPSLFGKNFWSVFGRGSSGRRNPVMITLILGAFLLAFAHSSLYSAFPLFCKDRLGLSAQNVGMLFVYLGLLSAITQGGLIRLALRRFSEETLLLWGSLLMAAGLAGLPWAASQKGLLVGLSALAVGASLNGPTLTSLLSKEAPKDRIGTTLGISQGFSALGRAIGPTWGGALYAAKAGLPFWLTGALVAGSVLIGACLMARHRVQASIP